MRSKAAAVFMAFGTKGDVYPLAAIAAAFACDQEQYQVFFVTHSAHENLRVHLRLNKVTYIPVSSPPVVSPLEHYGKMELSFSAHKREIIQKHRKEHPNLYNHLQEAPIDKVGWKDVIHWMWPLFTEEWGSWRSLDLNLSSLPFTDPVTGLPAFHERLPSPLLLYGFSKEVVECPGYWPSKVRVCGFWFPPPEWQFSCNNCAEISASVSSGSSNKQNKLCSIHLSLQFFIELPATNLPIFIGLSSVGSMGFLKNPHAFLRVLGTALDISDSRFILFSAGYEPLEAAIDSYTKEVSACSEQIEQSNGGVSLFGGRLFCFSGSIPYNWLFPRCAAAIHHGGSGSTAAALQAGVPQVICPFMLDQFYWAERMYWLGVAPEPLRREHLLPDKDEDFYIKEAANMLVRVLAYSQSSEVKTRALQISNKLSNEDGVSEAVRLIKEELRSSR
ncbi:putative UDP-sugar-dependent glycosyltransferase 52-like isoform X2 [Capsicum annuum]|nr:putative UDP-sugar-dependent glycosyltransferase 52-like isoform X2 [Capsicum annuum]